VLLGIAFAGLLSHALRVSYGTPSPEAPSAHGAPALRWPMLAAGIPLVAVILLFGIHVPDQVNNLLHDVATILEPASTEVAAR
jgi:hypothetical protein